MVQAGCESRDGVARWPSIVGGTVPPRAWKNRWARKTSPDMLRMSAAVPISHSANALPKDDGQRHRNTSARRAAAAAARPTSAVTVAATSQTTNHQPPRWAARGSTFPLVIDQLWAKAARALAGEIAPACAANTRRNHSTSAARHIPPAAPLRRRGPATTVAAGDRGNS